MRNSTFIAVDDQVSADESSMASSSHAGAAASPDEPRTPR